MNPNQENILMRRRILLLIIVPFLLFIAFGSYRFTKSDFKKTEALRLYRQGLKPIFDRNNSFNPQAELAFYDSLLKESLPLDKQLVVLAYRASTLLKLGKEKESSEILTKVFLTRNDISDKLSRTIEENLALSYLRLGERNNCIHNHSSGSCIFPIQGKGDLYRPLCITNSHPVISGYSTTRFR